MGRYCWVCGRRRANERFSGRGHARHLCRDCARRPREERDRIQALRDIQRFLGQRNITARNIGPTCGMLYIDDLTIRSDSDRPGVLEATGQTELVEDFTIDADGYASRKPAYDAAGNLTYDGLHEYTYDAVRKRVLTSRSGAQTCLYPLSHEARLARPERHLADRLAHHYP